MLTKELIKSQKALEGLTEEQIAAITTLSQNDENEVVGRVTGQVHGYYDEKLAQVLGVQKPSGVKSSEFWAEQVAEVKAKAAKAGDTGEVEKLKATIADLEKQIKEGKGDQALVQRLEQEKAQLAATVEDLRKQYKEGQEEWKTKLTEKEKAFHQIEVERLLDQDLADLKFKDTIPEALRKMAIQNAKTAILGQYETEIQDLSGTKRLVFKKDGAILSNKENGLNPFTGRELITQVEAIKEILDTGKQQPGAGTKAGTKATLAGDVVQVGAVKSKLEADNAIKEALAAQGIATTDPRYHEIKKNTWEQVVQPMNLPLR